MTERVLSILYRILAGVLALLCALIFGFGVLATVVFRQYQENDYPDFYRLNPILCALVFAALVLLLRLLLRRAGALSPVRAPRLTKGGVLVPDRWFAAMILFAGGFCAFLLYVIRGLPTNDARFCIEIAQQFLDGDYGAVQSGYLTLYPFQLSFCLFAEWLARLFGAGNYLPYQLGNVASILLSLFFLYEIAWELYEDIRVCRAMAALSFGGLVLYAYSTFIYNDIWSLAPLCGGFWFLIRFLNRGGFASGVIAAALAGISFFIKSNGAVALVAMGIVTVLAALRALAAGDKKRAGKSAAVLVLMILISLGLRGGVNAHYARMSGGGIPDGVPAAAYFAMGMTETDGKYGWYNGDNVRYLAEAGQGDAALASAAATAYMKERVAFLLAHPKTLVKFYLMKFLSQWGDPTAGGLREQELTGRHQEGMRPALAESMTFGTGFAVLQGVMHLFHLLLYFFAAAELFALCFGKRRLHEAAALLPLFVFGGMLFHELWEASGRYTLRYQIALLPLAAAGMVRIFARLPGRKP